MLQELVAGPAGPILFFLLRFADLHGVDLERALTRKLAKNAERYPVDKARGKNLKYTDL